MSRAANAVESHASPSNPPAAPTVPAPAAMPPAANTVVMRTCAPQPRTNSNTASESVERNE